MATQTNLFSYFPGLEVTSDEVLQAELLAEQTLAARFPDIDLREGTALSDMVIRPAAMLLALLNKATQFYFSQNTISDVTDSTTPEFVDQLMSNWFVTRHLGASSVINVRLYFSKGNTSVSLSTNQYFSTDGNLKFYPSAAESTTIPQGNFDSTLGQWFMDIDLVAETASSAYDLSSGSMLYFTNFNPYFMHAEINYLKQPATAVETNTQFLSRAKTAISTRNLINTPSILSNLSENFPSMDTILPRGFGDPEMIRDKIFVQPPLGTGVTNSLWIHNGGCVDAYCKTPLTQATTQFEIGSDGVLYLTGSIYKFERFQGDATSIGYDAADTCTLTLTPSVTGFSYDGAGTTTVLSVGHNLPLGSSVIFTGTIPGLPTGVDYLSNYIINSVTTDTFTFYHSFSNSPGVFSVSALANVNANVSTPFTWKNEYLITIPVPVIVDPIPTPPVYGLSYDNSSGLAKLFIQNHGLEIGERITIKGSEFSGYNGTFILSKVEVNNVYFIPNTPPPGPTASSAVTVSYVDRYHEVGFSERESIKIDFGTYGLPYLDTSVTPNVTRNRTVTFTYHFHSNLDGVDSYMTSSANRVVCGDYLARGFNLLLLDVIVVGYTSATPDALLAAKTITAYLNNLLPGQAFIMSDLLSELYTAGIQTIQTPLAVTYTKYWKDLLGITTGVITDALDPKDPLAIFMLNSVNTTSEVLG